MVWGHAADYVNNEFLDSESTRLHQTARRVAQALAVLAFGAEILIG